MHLARPKLVIGDTGNAALLEDIFTSNDIDTVMHFAAHTVVPESVADPLKYYRNNTASSRTLLEAAANNGVKNIVFSSTAAVYGIPEGGRDFTKPFFVNRVSAAQVYVAKDFKKSV